MVDVSQHITSYPRQCHLCHKICRVVKVFHVLLREAVPGRQRGIDVCVLDHDRESDLGTHYAVEAVNGPPYANAMLSL